MAGIRFSLARKAQLLIGLPLALQLFVVFSLQRDFAAVEKAAGAQASSKAIVSTTNLLVVSAYRSVEALVFYCINNDSEHQLNWKNCVNKTSVQLTSLNELLVHSELDPPLIRSLGKTGSKFLSVLNESGTSMSDKRASFKLFEGFKLNARVNEALNLFGEDLVKIGEAEAAKLDISRQRELDAKKRAANFLNLFWIGNALLTLGLLPFVLRGTIRDLNVLTKNAQLFALGKPLLPPIRNSDEIGELDRVFREMATAISVASRKERAIIDNARDVLCTMDSDGRFREISRAASSAWGYAPSDLIGRGFLEIIDEADLSAMRDEFARIVNSSNDAVFENRLVRKDGCRIFVRWSIFWSNEDLLFYCVAHDISERILTEQALQKSEERIRSLFEQIPIGIAVVNTSGTIEFVNRATAAIFDSTTDNLIGIALAKFLSKASFKGAVPEPATLALELSEKQRVIEGITASNEIVPLELILRRFENFGQDAWLVMIMDVTDRFEADRLKQEFMGVVSHDLRVPLTSVQGFLDLLESGAYGNISDGGVDRLLAAKRNASRLINLVEELLEVQRLESGRVELSIEAFAVTELFDSALDAVQQYASARSIKLEIEAGEFSVTGDRDKLLQVVVNLLANAINHSNENSAVLLGAIQSEEHCRIYVSDSGPGIARREQSKIFERFMQSANKGRGKTGFGLGLAICKGIVDQHSGKIGVDSELGHGSTFWFELPNHARVG